ncbi:hypothetical protein GS506_08355 [Rhodococcus hoagii]|nr:hypothetical protein [Prescottella equi]
MPRTRGSERNDPSRARAAASFLESGGAQHLTDSRRAIKLGPFRGKILPRGVPVTTLRSECGRTESNSTIRLARHCYLLI